MNIMQSILETSLFASIVIIAVLLLRRIFKSKLNYSVLSLLWLLVLLRLLMPMMAESPVHLDQLFPSMIQSETTSTTNVVQNMPEIAPSENAGDKQLEKHATSESVIEQQSKWQSVLNAIKAIDYWRLALGVWFIGLVFFLTKNMVVFYKFNRLISNSERLCNSKINQSMNEQKKKIHLKSKVSIIESECVSAPVTFKFFSPIILIPKNFVDRMDESKLRLMILHELCHIKRKDILKNMLWLFAKSIHWFNPLVAIAYKKYIGDLELFCDNRVLKYTDENDCFIYSQSLIDVLKFSKDAKNIPVALSFLTNKSKIEERIKSMIEPNKKPFYVTIISSVFVVILLVGCFTTACSPSENSAVAAEIEESDALHDQPIEIVDTEINEVKFSLQPEETIYQTAMQYRLTDSESFELVRYGKYYDDWTALVKLDDGQTTVEILNSDLSLVSLNSDEFFMPVPVTLDEHGFSQKIQEYFAKYFPNIPYDQLQVQRFDIDEGCYADLMFDDEIDTTKHFIISLNGEGQLFSIQVVTYIGESDSMIDASALEAKAREYLLSKQEFATDDQLVIGSQDEMGSTLHFDYSYFSENPSIDDYSFSAAVFVTKVSGEVKEMYIHPAFGENDVLEWQDIEEISAEYIEETYGVKREDLFYNEFTFNFDHGVLAYRATYFDEEEEIRYHVDIDANGQMLDITQFHAEALG